MRVCVLYLWEFGVVNGVHATIVCTCHLNGSSWLALAVVWCVLEMVQDGIALAATGHTSNQSAIDLLLDSIVDAQVPWSPLDFALVAAQPSAVASS